MSNQEQTATQVAAPDTAADVDRTLAPSRLILIRHGESTWNAARRTQGQSDPPLSDRGVVQAREVAERLAGGRVAGHYCSDLTRARHTAEVIASVIGVEPVSEPGLREVALGEWEGRTREELMDGFPELWERWARDPSWDIVPGGEGEQPFTSRVVATLDRLRQRHPHGDVVCVTHGGVIQVALLEVLGRPGRGFFHFVIQNCSLTVIQHNRNRTVVTAVNDTCHLS
jgi:probable phosphoglycerate mutase